MPGSFPSGYYTEPLTFTSSLDAFEGMVGGRPEIFMWYLSFSSAFPLANVQAVAARGQTPMISWMPDVTTGTPSTNANIIAGSWDTYLNTFAAAVASYGGPVWIRLGFEMNGVGWFQWQDSSFVGMWNHVQDRFTAAGATNVKWVWSPNVVSPSYASLSSVYPGSSRVDVVGLDGYNWGNPAPAGHASSWQTFSQVFGESIGQVKALAPDKPFWITETASAEAGGSKTAWITDMFRQLRNYDLDGVIWFNANKETDWRVNSSAAALAAYAALFATARPNLVVQLGLGGSATIDPAAGFITLGVGPGLGTGMLGSVAWTDVVDDVVAVRYARGRPSAVDQSSPGQATIVLDNASGDYDPTNPASPYVADTFTTVADFDGGLDGWSSEGGSGVTTSLDTVVFHDGGGSLQCVKTVASGSFQSLRVTDNVTTTHDETPAKAYACWVWCASGETGWSARIDITDSNGTNIGGGSTALTPNDWTYVYSTFGPLQVVAMQRKTVQISHPSPTAGSKTFRLDSVVRWDAGSLIQAGIPVRVRAQFETVGGTSLYPGTAVYPGATQYPGEGVALPAIVDELYRGVIDTINVDVGWEPTVTFTCVDALEALGRAFVPTTLPSFDGDPAGVRIGRILDAALWPTSMRALDSGWSVMQATTFGDNALPLAQAVASSEFGLLFVGGDGRVVFYDRWHEYTSARSIGSQAIFSDSGVDIDFESISVQIARDTVANDVRLTRDGGEEQQAADLVSQGKYGLRTWSGPNTPTLRDDTAALNAAQWLAVRFADPTLAITNLTVDATTQGMWSTLLSLDLLDRVTVSRDYGPSTIVRQLLIQELAVEITPDSWRYTFALASPVLRSNVAVLDHPPALGTARLAY